MTVKVKDNSKGYLNALTQLDKKVVKVGLLAKAGTENIEKGITNEFGAVKIFTAYDGLPIVIPERSFIRSTFDDEKDKVADRFKQIYKAISNKKYGVVNKLKAIGIEHEGKVKQKITNIKEPPNSERTVKFKGFDNPLIHTGEMRSKVSSEVKDK
jgi:hypothetical protein